MKLVHAASRSHATAPGASSSSWMRQAMDGNGPSGDEVPTRIMSRSLARFPLERLPAVRNHLHLLETRLGKLHVVLVLDRGDELHQVERVGGQVASEALVHLHLVGVDAEDLGRELLQLLEVELRCHV